MKIKFCDAFRDSSNKFVHRKVLDSYFAVFFVDNSCTCKKVIILNMKMRCLLLLHSNNKLHKKSKFSQVND